MGCAVPLCVGGKMAAVHPQKDHFPLWNVPTGTPVILTEGCWQ